MNLTPEQEHLVMSHVGHARNYIRRRFGAFGTVVDDYEQQAVIGLMQAAVRFDPARNRPFWSYARHWVFKYVTEYIGIDRTIRPSWDDIKGGVQPTLTANVALDERNEDGLTLYDTHGYVQPEYEMIENEVTWAKIASHYSPETIETWQAWREGKVKIDDLDEDRKACVRMLHLEVWETF